MSDTRHSSLPSQARDSASISCSGAGMSDAGRARLDDILHEAQLTLRRRRLLRSARAAGAWSIGGFAIVGAVLTFARPLLSPAPRVDDPIAIAHPEPEPATAVAAAQPATQSPPPQPVRITIVRDDPDIVRRWRAPATPIGAPIAATMSDEELSARLREAGLPSGLIRVESRLILEASLALRPSDSGV